MRGHYDVFLSMLWGLYDVFYEHDEGHYEVFCALLPPIACRYVSLLRTLCVTVTHSEITVWLLNVDTGELKTCSVKIDMYARNVWGSNNL
jgi:hypothetical protein